MIEFKKTEKNPTGLNIDKTYFIMKEQEIIGTICISMIKDGGCFIEWIEFFKHFKGQHLLRPVLKAFMKKYKTVYLEADNELFPIYLHLGCKVLEHDDFREMTTFKLDANCI